MGTDYIKLGKSETEIYAKVRFLVGKEYYYLSKYPVQIGDKVLVEGTMENEEGTVTDVSEKCPQIGLDDHILNVVSAYTTVIEPVSNNIKIELTKDEAKGKWVTVKDAFGNVHVTRYKGDEKELFVPGKIDNKAISMVGLYSTVNDMISDTKQKVKIEKVVISDGIKYIAKYAFAGLTNLKEVIIPDSVTYISPLAFFGSNHFVNTNKIGKSYADEVVDYIGHYDGTILDKKSFCVVRNENYNNYEEHHSLGTDLLASWVGVFDGKLQPKPNSATKYVIVEDDLYTDAVKLKDFMKLRNEGKCFDARAILASELRAHVDSINAR